MGALGFTAFNALFYLAAHNTTALNMGIIQGTVPVFVLLGGYLLYRERVSAMQMSGVGLTLLGVITPSKVSPTPDICIAETRSRYRRYPPSRTNTGTVP